jgi:site-specific DNA-methyltransferase (adenine-specific)
MNYLGLNCLILIDMNVYYSAQDAPEILPRNSIVNDCFEVAVLKIASGSVDAVIIDPPYTDGKTDALPNHKIQSKIDIDLVMREAYRILKDDGFFVFFGQMPTVLSWLNSATNVFRYKEHITWCKRNITSPYLDIQRSKEEIFIYCKGKPKYHETQAKYEDLKTPALHVGIYELSTIKTTISDLQRRCIDNAYNMKYFSGVPTSRGDHNDKTLRYTSADRPKNDISDFEDATRANSKQENKKEDRGTRERNDDIYNERYASSFRYRSKHWCNLTNVWAFMPTKERPTSYSQLKKRTKQVPPIWSYLSQNQTKMGAKGENWKHPTVKPVLLLERLIKLLTPEPTEDYTPLIVDFFGGSGTTFLGSLSTKRDCIICEKYREYVDMTVHRSQLILGQNSIENHQSQTALPATAQPPKPKFIQQNMFD